MPSICELKERVRELERAVERERTCNLQHGHRYADSEIARLHKENAQYHAEWKLKAQELEKVREANHRYIDGQAEVIARLQSIVDERNREIKELKKRVGECNTIAATRLRGEVADRDDKINMLIDQKNELFHKNNEMYAQLKRIKELCER